MPVSQPVAAAAAAEEGRHRPARALTDSRRHSRYAPVKWHHSHLRPSCGSVAPSPTDGRTAGGRGIGPACVTGPTPRHLSCDRPERSLSRKPRGSVTSRRHHVTSPDSIPGEGRARRVSCERVPAVQHVTPSSRAAAQRAQSDAGGRTIPAAVTPLFVASRCIWLMKAVESAQRKISACRQKSQFIRDCLSVRVYITVGAKITSCFGLVFTVFANVRTFIHR